MMRVEPFQEAQARPIYCRVMWCEPGEEGFVAGLLFNDSQANLRSSWVKPMLKELGFEDLHIEQMRQSVRVPMRLPLKIGSLDGNTVNLSAGGALVEVPCGLDEEAFSEVHIQRPDGTVLQMPVQVVGRRESAGSWRYSLKFSGPSEQASETWANWLGQLVRPQPARGGGWLKLRRWLPRLSLSS